MIHSERPQEPSYRILLVDDCADTCDSMAMLLTIEGHVIETAADGREGIEAVERWRPDLVLMGLNMPVMDGYEAARRIRTQPCGRELLLIALTGWDDPEGALAAGFDFHLLKPLDLGMLTELLAEAFPPAGSAQGVSGQGTACRRPRRELLLRRMRKGR
jgi:CheY-like chemotaxis protein